MQIHDIISLMCGRCEGEPYSGVKALFNGDLQAEMAYADRENWMIISNRITVYLGASALSNELHPLFRGCKVATNTINEEELSRLDVLSRELSRPALGAS